MDHTADEGIRVVAPDLPQLYARAAWGMFSLIADLDGVRETHSLDVSVSACDREALMVRWLSELNFLHQTRHEIYARFAVHRVTDTALAATVGGECIDLSRHNLYTEIKAVTYHELQIAGSPGAWTATIIVDV